MLVAICLHRESHETSALQYKQFNFKNKILTGAGCKNLTTGHWTLLMRMVPLDFRGALCQGKNYQD